MIIVNAILYLSSTWYSILSFNHFFGHYLALLKNNENYRKYDIFFDFRFTEKYDISVNCGKSRKYDIYVERFYENVVFHAVLKKRRKEGGF